MKKKVGQRGPDRVLKRKKRSDAGLRRKPKSSVMRVSDEKLPYIKKLVKMPLDFIKDILSHEIKAKKMD